MTELTLLWPVDYNADLDIQNLNEDEGGHVFNDTMTNFLTNNSVWYTIEFQADYARIQLYLEGDATPITTAALNQIASMRSQGILNDVPFYALTGVPNVQSI